jgi:hypothetical protein
MAKGYPGRRRSANAYWRGVDSSARRDVTNPYANPHLAKVYEQGRQDGLSGRWADNPAPPRPKPKPRPKPGPTSGRGFGAGRARGPGGPSPRGPQRPRRPGDGW